MYSTSKKIGISQNEEFKHFKETHSLAEFLSFTNNFDKFHNNKP